MTESSAYGDGRDVAEVVEEDVGILGEELFPVVKARGHGDGHRAEGAGAVDVERGIADHDGPRRGGTGSRPSAWARRAASDGSRRRSMWSEPKAPIEEVSPEPGAARA